MKHIAIASVAALAGTLLFARVAASYEETDGPKIQLEGDTVIVSDELSEAYLLVAHLDGELVETRMIYGKEAQGTIKGASEVTIDVYRVDALGTLEFGRFKPCTPREDEDPNNPDCTPIGDPPPPAPKRFEIVESALN